MRPLCRNLSIRENILQLWQLPAVAQGNPSIFQFEAEQHSSRACPPVEVDSAPAPKVHCSPTTPNAPEPVQYSPTEPAPKAPKPVQQLQHQKAEGSDCK